MDQARTISGAFVVAQRTLTVTKGGTGTGTVTGTGINCGADCTEAYAHGTMVTLMAAGGAGSSFSGWGGACTGTSSCVVTMDMAQSVSATFTLGSNVLSVTKAGTGEGTVTSGGNEIACGATCNADFPSGTMVTLTAAPTTGSTFAGWSGDCGGTGTCTVTLSAARNVTATFTLNTFALTVTPSGSGTGTVTSMPAGIACGADSTEAYGFGTSVTLSATANATSDFTGWSGAGCAGTGTCTVSMTAVRNVTAQFTLKTYALTVTKNGTGGGTVSSMPGGVSCGATCSATFNHGTMVTLSAAVQSSYPQVHPDFLIQF
jgi:hypothetical protein